MLSVSLVEQNLEIAALIMNTNFPEIYIFKVRLNLTGGGKTTTFSYQPLITMLILCMDVMGCTSVVENLFMV